ncbi:MAG: hypothetical protein WAV90_00570 [Gordonia amarae]
MSQNALLPCFSCGAELPNVCVEEENQPYGGTEFRTYGHYGSTFWDDFEGEELVLNVCDDCLRAHTGRLAQQKRYLPVVAPGRLLVGRSWVQRPMVPYTGNPDDTEIRVDTDEIGDDPGIEWLVERPSPAPFPPVLPDLQPDADTNELQEGRR